MDRVQERLHCGQQESAARAGLYLLIEDVTVRCKVTPVILHGVVSPDGARLEADRLLRFEPKRLRLPLLYRTNVSRHSSSELSGEGNSRLGENCPTCKASKKLGCRVSGLGFHRLLGISLLQGPRGGPFLMSKVSL